MIQYITGSENKTAIDSALFDIQMEYNQAIASPIISNNLDLKKEVKINIAKNKDISTLIIDLSVCNNTDEELLSAIKQVRFFNDSCKFIIIALEKSVGDNLLSSLVDFGIYSIITNEDELIGKIKDYSIKAATFKEASIYKIQEEDNSSRKNKSKTDKIKNNSKKNGNKIILKPMKQKITISICGTQSRIGVCHTGISLAYTLMKMGYVIALVETEKKDNFADLIDCYEANVYSNSFRSLFKINNIDFYSNTSQEELQKIQGLSYDYIIIVNGNFNDNTIDFTEHNRADVKICVFGTKAWEQKYLLPVVGEANLLESHKFLTLCDEETQKDVSSNFKDLGIEKNIYFANYNPEPFTEDLKLLDLMQGFIYEEKKNDSFFKKIFSK